jgi:hypothetical protein
MILAVILFVGMIAILVYSIYRGFHRCHGRIDEQNNTIGKIHGRIDNINSEITNIKIEQATMKTVQNIKLEDNKAQTAATPLHIYQQQSPQQYIQTAAESVPQPVGYSYEQVVKQPVEQQRAQQPQPFAEQQAPRHAQQTGRGKPMQKQGLQYIGQPFQEQPQQRPQQASRIFRRNETPVYQKTSIPASGFTEFQIPDEYDIESELFSSQFEEQIRPESIPPKERITPSKFNSLNDGITRTGKRYSEEELAHRILD